MGALRPLQDLVRNAGTFPYEGARAFGACWKVPRRMCRRRTETSPERRASSLAYGPDGKLENARPWKLLFIPLNDNVDTNKVAVISEETLKYRAEVNIQVVVVLRNKSNSTKNVRHVQNELL